MKIIKRDREYYSRDSFIGYCQPWSDYTDKTVKAGVNFENHIEIDTDTFPHATGFGWSWPDSLPTATGVRGYNHIAYGNYDSGVPAVPIAPVQVKALRTFRQSFGWEYERDSGRFNLLTECFLTKTKGDAASKIFEVGFFLHAPAETVAFCKGCAHVDSFVDQDGRSWAVTKQGGAVPFLMFMPTADVMSDAIDMKAALAFLKSKGIITGEEWVNGVGFGVEPLAGSGSIDVQFWSPVLA